MVWLPAKHFLLIFPRKKGMYEGRPRSIIVAAISGGFVIVNIERYLLLDYYANFDPLIK